MFWDIPNIFFISRIIIINSTWVRNDLISSCYFLYCPGVTPNLFLNTVLNRDKLEYPTA